MGTQNGRGRSRGELESAHQSCLSNSLQVEESALPLLLLPPASVSRAPLAANPSVAFVSDASCSHPIVATAPKQMHSLHSSIFVIRCGHKEHSIGAPSLARPPLTGAAPQKMEERALTPLRLAATTRAVSRVLLAGLRLECCTFQAGLVPRDERETREQPRRERQTPPACPRGLGANQQFANGHPRLACC